MSYYVQKIGINNISAGAGEFDTLLVPRKIRGPGQYGVVLCHGAEAGTGTTFDWFKTNTPIQSKLAGRLAYMGVPVVLGRMGGNTFGTDAISGTAGSAYINNAISYMAAQTGCSGAKAIVGGSSMGAGIAARWASLNQSKAAAIFGLIPMASIERLYTDNTNMTVAGNTSFTYGVAQAWGLANRFITDGVVNGTTQLTSATAAFTVADVGRQVVRGFTQTAIPVNTKIASVTNGTTVVLDKLTGSGSGQQLVIAAPLPMAGTAGADLIGVHAPRINTADIPNRWYYATDDSFIVPSDVTALATAAGGTAYGTTGNHTDNMARNAQDMNGGTDWDELIEWFVENGV